MSNHCFNDDTLGPVVYGCRDDFDFTVRFEEVFLTIIPDSLFVATTVFRIVYLSRKKKIAVGGFQRWLKLLFLMVFTGMQLGVLILSCRTTELPSRYTVASESLRLVASFFMILLSFLEHTHSPRPSILINIYLLVTVLFDIARSRTLWISRASRNETYQAQFSVTVTVLKAIIFVLESLKATRVLQSPELTSGIISLSTYFWVNTLLITGFRKPLATNDLYAIDEAMSAKILYAQFSPHLEKHVTIGSKHILLKSLFSTLTVPFVLPILPRLCNMAFIFCQPLLIQSLLNYLQDAHANSPPNKGYGFIGAAVLIYLGMATSTSLYWYFQERFVYMLRGVLISAIYHKTTVVTLAAANDSEALTLINADVDRVKNGFQQIHEYWANTIEVALACWLLQRQIGVAFVAPIMVVVFCTAASMVVAKLTGKRQTLWMGSIHKRVGATTKAIADIKALKISGMSGSIAAKISDMRLKELNAGGHWRLMLLAAGLIALTPSQLGPVMTFAVASQTLSATRIFTSMAYLMLLAAPLGSLFQNIPQLVSAFVCLGRIQAYLNKASRVDTRKTFDASILSEKQTNVSSKADHSALSLSGVSFGWAEGKNVLENIDITVPCGALTIILGPVASGKSTLLKALLGEIPVRSGDVIVGVQYRKIGYCDQTPFLYNDTIFANIIGSSEFDPERYKEIIEATSLSTDFDTMPEGDRTMVGSNGVALSGGQQQRVALARALYLQSDLLILDDILSGLDAITARHICLKLFGSNGLSRRRGATAVLCTHSDWYASLADHIIILGGDGSIAEQGSFANLQASSRYCKSFEGQYTEGASEPNQRCNNSQPDRVASMRSTTEASAVAKALGIANNLGDGTVYKHYFGSISPWVTALVLLWCCIYGFTFNFPTVWLKFWSEDAVAPKPTHPRAFYMGIYALLQVICLGSLLVVVFLSTQTMISQSGKKLHTQALRTLIGAPLRLFSNTEAGTVANLFAQDIALIDSDLPMALTNFLLLVFAAMGMAAVIAISSPWLALSYPFLVGILYWIQTFYLRTSKQLRVLELEAKDPFSHFINTLNGLATLRALGSIPSTINSHNELLDTSQRSAYQLAIVQRWLQLTLKFLVAIIATIVVALATQLRANTGFTGASLVTLMSFGDTLTTIVQSYTKLETSIGAVARLKTFSDMVTPEARPGEDMVPNEGWPTKGTIHVSAVSASYEETQVLHGLANENKLPSDVALRDINLSIRSGEKVAICGRTGSGKSSIVLLLLRLLEIIPGRDGKITVDSLPIEKVDREILRSRIIAVSQDAIFLPDGSTVRENLDPVYAAKDSECLSVLKEIGLSSVIHERGGIDACLAAESLSQGQKQLFCLARAVLRRRVKSRKGTNGGILLLDEFSSNVDQNTDLEMQKIIRREFDGYTIMMVSHRLEMVLEFDTVIVMDKGQVAEVGNPRMLKDQEGAMFQGLWNNSRAKE
ncbi:ABC transporter [Colletotrichum truncatum]|uniref:ABC transporter n=1 Tax=Colletotrichum truncatum TaxID=5467 RepID=A0ACC3YFR5_COLTU|nr:ABC transporter [Colletotrichum truncatum]KAF6788410.1 ABC transporter [Colletotrichum truncatum]